jgi:predicted  nucleic acid-binding Zn-ribbon protein
MASQSFDDVERAWFTIDQNFHDLYAAAGNDAEREQLTQMRDSARDTYWKAVADGLAANDAMVVDTRKQLEAAQAQLDASIADMQNFSETIDRIAQVVRLAAALVTLAGA